MNIQKTRNVKTPSRGTNLSAGLDFYVPEDFQETTIHSGESVLIPSGIRAHVPSGYALIAFNKSGVFSFTSITSPVPLTIRHDLKNDEKLPNSVPEPCVPVAIAPAIL